MRNGTLSYLNLQHTPRLLCTPPASITLGATVLASSKAQECGESTACYLECSGRGLCRAGRCACGADTFGGHCETNITLWASSLTRVALGRVYPATALLSLSFAVTNPSEAQRAPEVVISGGGGAIEIEEKVVDSSTALIYGLIP